MKRFINWLKNGESGQAMMECGLIIALFAVVVVTALTTLGDNVTGAYDNVSAELTTTTTP